MLAGTIHGESISRSFRNKGEAGTSTSVLEVFQGTPELLRRRLRQPADGFDTNSCQLQTDYEKQKKKDLPAMNKWCVAKKV